MLLRRFVTPGLAINSYLLSDEKSGKGVLIDPTRDIDPYLARALQDNIEITHIIETHVHADFLSGAIEVKKALKDKPIICCSGMGGKEWIPSYRDQIIHDLDEIFLGSIRLQAVHTPGHTPEHLIWIVFDTSRNPSLPEIAFTGDLLFVGSVGRPDLMGKTLQDILIKQLYHSLFATVRALPDYIEIFPSHGAGSLCGKDISMRESSTLGYEKRCNPWFIIKPFDEWKNLLMLDMPSVPHYFSRMKQMNLKGPSQTTPALPVFLNSEQFQKASSTCYIIDTRSPDKFLNHYKGSINIPFGPSFSTWAAIALTENRPIVLVMETPTNALPAMAALKLIGIDHVHGIFTTNNWEDRHITLEKFSVIDVKTLRRNIDDYFVLDVRTPHEWHIEHIHQAHHLELAHLLDSLEELPKDKPIAVICRSGARSSVAASLLIKHGYPQTFSVSGGMQKWSEGVVKK